jgi:hypothetical protein
MLPTTRLALDSLGDNGLAAKSGFSFSIFKKLPLVNSDPHSEQVEGVMIENTTISSFWSLCDLWLLPINALAY